MSTIFKYKSVCFKNFFKIYEIRPLYNTAAHAYSMPESDKFLKGKSKII